jgi:hypothetical protein
MRTGDYPAADPGVDGLVGDMTCRAQVEHHGVASPLRVHHSQQLSARVSCVTIAV